MIDNISFIFFLNHLLELYIYDSLGNFQTLTESKGWQKPTRLLKRTLHFFLRGADNHRIRSERTIKKKEVGLSRVGKMKCNEEISIVVNRSA